MPTLPLTVPGRPVQPRVDHDVTARSGGSLLPAHGALVTDLTEQGAPITDFDAAWARATIDGADSAPELVAGDVSFPDRFATVSTFSDRSGAPAASGGPKLRQRLVVAPGTFFSDPASTTGTGTQTLFSRVGGDVLYSTSDDFEEPTISSIDATSDPATHVLTITADATDDTGVSGVVAMVRDDAGWHRVDLLADGGGTWTGTFTPTSASGTVAYFTQAFDAAGNVATRSAKGSFLAASPTPAISVSDARVVEPRSGSAEAEFTVTLDRPSVNPVVVDWSTADGSAKAITGDYRAASGTVTFAPGETTMTVSVPVLADTVQEDDETFTLHLANPVDATIDRNDATGTIESPDAIVDKGISVSDVTATEGDAQLGTMRFIVSLDAPATSTVSVDVATEDISATGGTKLTVPGVDYKSYSRTIVFSRGQVAKAISIPVVSDTAAEGTERMRLALSNASGAPIGAIHWWDIGADGHVGVDLLGGGATVFMASTHLAETWGTALGVNSVARYDAATSATM